MHGAIIAELLSYVGATFGSDFRCQMLRTAGIAPRLFMPISTYPDEEVVAIICAATQLSGKSEHEFLVAFGSHLALGVARHNAESLDVTQSECMNDGANRCVLHFRLSTPAPRN